MICPNCKYAHGYDWNESDEYVGVVGKEGDFYDTAIKMERTRAYADPEQISSYGCPACKIVFIAY